MDSFYQISRDKLREWCENSGIKKFRAGQIFSWVYDKYVFDPSMMSDLDGNTKNLLVRSFSFSGLELAGTEESDDKQTVKFLWRLSDGMLVESVLIFAPGRRTVCVSSQVGCPARCAFCASGKEGLLRNLSCTEIFEQVYRIEGYLARQGSEKVSHIVYMGMGEPLENYDEVTASVRMLCDPDRLGFSERKITVSTVGVIEGIHRLKESGLKPNLVLSLHAPNQNIRKKIIPYARRYDLAEVLAAIRSYAKTTGRDITYEYTLLSGINDSPVHAEELAVLIAGDPCMVNLIPYNPVPGLHLRRPERDEIEMFESILIRKGITVTRRYTKGKDIAAACGQLALKKPLALIPACE